MSANLNQFHSRLFVSIRGCLVVFGCGFPSASSQGSVRSGSARFPELLNSYIRTALTAAGAKKGPISVVKCFYTA